MKWTKTETIEFDPDNLPDEVFETIVPTLLDGINVWFWECDGSIGLTHEWDDEITNRKWMLDKLAIEALSREPETEQIEMMLAELEKAATVLRAALPPNAR